jgi:hypothetical protein
MRVLAQCRFNGGNAMTDPSFIPNATPGDVGTFSPGFTDIERTPAVPAGSYDLTMLIPLTENTYSVSVVFIGAATVPSSIGWEDTADPAVKRVTFRNPTNLADANFAVTVMSIE